MSDLQIPAAALRAGYEALKNAHDQHLELGQASACVVHDASPFVVATAYRAIADQLEPVRAEWREVDGRGTRSSALGYAISLLRQQADELDGGAS